MGQDAQGLLHGHKHDKAKMQEKRIANLLNLDGKVGLPTGYCNLCIKKCIIKITCHVLGETKP